MPEPVKDYKHIILFDGVCNLCSGWVYFVYKRDHAELFVFTPVQSEHGKEILRWCGLPEDTYETMVYIQEGTPYFKSTAFLRIVKLLRMPWPFLYYGRFLPKSMRDWIYDRIALNRYKLFGIKEACMVPNSSISERFI